MASSVNTSVGFVVMRLSVTSFLGTVSMGVRQDLPLLFV